MGLPQLPRNRGGSKKFRKLTHSNIVLFQQALSHVDWTDVFNDDANFAYEQFIHIFLRLYDKHFPLKAWESRSQISFIGNTSVTRPMKTRLIMLGLGTNLHLLFALRNITTMSMSFRIRVLEELGRKLTISCK